MFVERLIKMNNLKLIFVKHAVVDDFVLMGFNGYMSFGNKLKTLRIKFDLKQLDLANSLSVSAQAVSKWERDENYPDILTLKKMARLFDVSVDDLLEMYDEKKDVFEATILCSGINHFAEKSARMTPVDLADLMNTLFSRMTEKVLKLGGVPIKYTGDGFLCFFSGTGHADRAVDAAELVLRTFPDQDIVVFLNAGPIYLGMVGHPDYASKDVCGDAVNRAFLMLNAFSQRVNTGIGCAAGVKEALKKPRTFKIFRKMLVPHIPGKCDLYALRS